MGSCQNYGPFLGTLHNRCRIMIGSQKGTIILTSTHIYHILYSISYYLLYGTRLYYILLFCIYTKLYLPYTIYYRLYTIYYILHIVCYILFTLLYYTTPSYTMRYTLRKPLEQWLQSVLRCCAEGKDPGPLKLPGPAALGRLIGVKG